jgi:hypothetical protein
MIARPRPAAAPRSILTRRLVGVVLGIALLATLAGCSSAPRLIHAWQAPDYAGPQLENVIVVGVSERASTRRIFENVFAAKLREHGVQATASHAIFPANERIGREEFVRVARERGFDGVILTRVVGVDLKATYTPGYVMVEPATMYPRDFWGYYGRSVRVYESPGHLSTYDVVSVETNLYSLDEPMLVWSGQTETVDPSNLEKESAGLADVVMRELAVRGLVAPAE